MSYKVSVKDLAKNNVHFGHKVSKRHPHTQSFIWGIKNSAYLIDLSKTSFMLESACKYLENLFSNGGQALWLGTKKQASKAVAEVGASLEQPKVIHRWIGGTFTNYDQVQKAITKLLHMNDVVAKPMPYLKKKEVAMMKKEAERLDKNVGGLVAMKGLPKALIVVDVKREATAIQEAHRCGIPVVGIVDTNSSTDMIDVVIPANDDSDKSVNIILKQLEVAVKNGLSVFAEKEKVRLAEEKAVKAKQTKALSGSKGAQKAEKAEKPAEKKDAARASSKAKVASKTEEKKTEKKATEAKPAAKKTAATKPKKSMSVVKPKAKKAEPKKDSK